MAQNQYSNYYNRQQQQYQQHPGYQQPQVQQQSTVQYPNQRSFHRPQQQQGPYQQQFTPQLRSSLPQQQQQQQYSQSQSAYARPPSQASYTQQSTRPRSATALLPSASSAHAPYPIAQPLQRQTSQTSFQQQPSTQTSTAQQAYYQAIAKQKQAQAQSPIAYPNQQQPPQSAYNRNTSPTSRYSSYNQGQNQVHITRAPSLKPQPGVMLSSPVTPSGSGRPLPTPKSRRETVPPIARQQSFPIPTTNANQAQIPVRAPAPSSPTRPSVLNTPPGSISNTSFGSPPAVGPSSTPSPTKAGGRPLPTPGGGTKHMSMDFGSGFRAKSRSPSPNKPATSAPTRPQPTSTSPIKPASPFKSFRPAVPPPIRPEDLNLVLPSGRDSPGKFVPHWKKTLENLPPVVVASVPPPRSTPSPPKPGVDMDEPVSIQYSHSRPGSWAGYQPPSQPSQPSQQPAYSQLQSPQSPSRPASRVNSHVGLFNGAAPMGNRPPPPQHPLKKDVPPKPGMAFLSPSPKSRRAELPADDGYDRSTGGWGQEGEDSEEGEAYTSANEEVFEKGNGVDYEQEHAQEEDEDWEVVSESERGYASEMKARRAAAAARRTAGRTASPQYGIRGLPHRRSQSPPKPALPPRSPILPEAPQQAQQGSIGSLTLHMATTSLSNANYSNAIPNRRSPSPTRQPSPARQQDQWIPGRLQAQWARSQPFSSNAHVRQAQKREVVNLDDTPPPSLRKSPAPPSFTPPALPPRRWTPSTTNTPTTPPTTYATRKGPASPLSSPRAESPIPVGGRDSIPKISFPGNESDEDKRGGPSIMVSGPEDASVTSIAVSAPQMSISVSEPESETRISNNNRPRGHSHTDNRLNEARRDLPLPPSKRRGGMVCGGCDGAIIGRIVSAMGVRWHPGCFRCTVCNELLEHVSSFEHEGMPYCHLDYHENFAPRCYHCETAIIDERFITLDDPALGKRTYHEQHFFCAECGDPFLAPRIDRPHTRAAGELNVAGDGAFEEDDVGFTVYKGHPYCEACHVRLRLPKCKRCKKSIRDKVEAVEALGGKWCWECFTCASCEKPFEDPSFFERNGKPFCETCFSIILRNEV